jgi:hypothetical protein
MKEIHNLRAQISNIVAATFPGTKTDLGVRLSPPNDHQVRTVQSSIVSGFSDSLQAQRPETNFDGRLPGSGSCS